jgi:hypothetical protein
VSVQVTCPALVIHGEADVPVPVTLAENIVAAMPNARPVVIPGGGHRPDIRTPELVNPLLLEFLLVLPSPVWFSTRKQVPVRAEVFSTESGAP